MRHLEKRGGVILGDVVGKKLERDKASELGVFRLVHNTHATTAELFNNAVVRDGLPDHIWLTPDKQR